jgi:hypothetical protein
MPIGAKRVWVAETVAGNLVTLVDKH